MGTVQWLTDIIHFCTGEPSVTEQMSFLESNLVLGFFLNSDRSPIFKKLSVSGRVIPDSLIFSSILIEFLGSNLFRAVV